MEQKKMILEKLRQYDILCQAVENLPLEIGFCKDRQQRRELKKALQDAKKRQLQVQRGLQVLTPAERLILEQLYVYPGGKGTVQRLCQMLQVESSSVYRYRDRALRKFSQAVFGIEN